MGNTLAYLVETTNQGSYRNEKASQHRILPFLVGFVILPDRAKSKL